MADIKSLVTIDDLEKIDVRVGKITSVEEVKNSEKLVVLRVDFGEFTRQIVVGMKQERSDTTEVVGLQALFVVNLAPREIKGVKSEGMLFDIGYADGIVPVLAVPEKPVPNGVRAG
jgi:methionine--tRNA ligase beta chain